MLSLHRKKNSFTFHYPPITSIKILLQGELLFLTACNPEIIVRCLLSSSVFNSVMERTHSLTHLDDTCSFASYRATSRATLRFTIIFITRFLLATSWGIGVLRLYYNSNYIFKKFIANKNKHHKITHHLQLQPHV